MKIYLDSCVLQDLKKAENSSLLALIKADKKRNIYCFSHAHLLDLTRDETDYKYLDMEFMEEIVEDNCIFYNKKVHFSYRTPTDYYDDYSWPTKAECTAYLTGAESVTNSFTTLMGPVSLSLNDLVMKENLTANTPTDMANLLVNPTNMAEFAEAMGGLTNGLMAEPKKFKKLLQYLHQNAKEHKLHEMLNLEGYDGKKVTDKDAFRKSYTNYFLKTDRDNFRIDVYQNMYNGLEIFGIIPGSPNKQKMMNMVNDAQHSFFGGFCDIVVSKDNDFINKTKFMYDLQDMHTCVITMAEFEYFLQYGQITDETMEDLLKLRQIPTDAEPFLKESQDSINICSYWLSHLFWGYFNTISKVTRDDGEYHYFSQYLNNFSSVVLTKDIERITNLLFAIYGNDAAGLGIFSRDEINGKEWSGRTWIFKDGTIVLNAQQRLFLAIYPTHAMAVDINKRN